MARLQSDPPEAVGRVPQNLQQGCRFARYLHFLHDPARVIHNADAGLLDRYVQSRKMVHAALLLLMLEAVTKDLVFTISLKRSTQNLQLSTNWAGRLPHLRLLPAGAVAGWGLHPLESAALSRRTPGADFGMPD